MPDLQAPPKTDAPQDLIFATDHDAIVKLEKKGSYLLAIAIVFSIIGVYILITTFFYGGRSTLLIMGVGAAMLYPLSQYAKFRKLLPRIKADAQQPILAQAGKHLRRGFLFAGIAAGLAAIIFAGAVILVITLAGFQRGGHHN